MHKDLFPFDNSDIWGTILVTLGTLIAASGGIGGGGILVPLLILVFGFTPKYAVPLSNICIVGSSITNIFMNLMKRHPNADRPLVDWDLILVMEPITMGGAVVGAMVGKVLPDWILVILLVILLAYTSWISIEKGVSQFQNETKQKELDKRNELQKVIELDNMKTISEESERLLIGEIDEAEISETKYGDNMSGLNTELRKLLDEEKNTPTDKMFIMTGMVIIVILLNLLKGGGGTFPSPVGIQCGSYHYWLLTALIFVVVVVISIWMREILIAKWKLKKRLRYRYIEGDIEWNPINTIIYPCLVFFAGFFAGMFGVGGGIVKGPLMLYMGVHPLVASATCSVMIMFTSVAATTMFIAFGTLTLDYGIYLFVIGLLATIVGQYGVSYLVDKYKRYSLVSLSIGSVVLISTLLMAIQSIFSLVDIQSGVASSSTSFCGK